MKWLWLFVAIVVVGFGVWYAAGQQPAGAPPTNTATTTTATTSVDIIPGVPNQTYANTQLGFSLEYPAIASSSQVQFDGYLPLTQTSVVSFMLPRSMFEGTNLAEAGVYIGATTTPGVVRSCTRTSRDRGETATSTATIDGQTFAVFTSRGAGAGNYYDEKVYRTIQNGACLEIAELLHSGNIGNYTPGSVREFDRARFLGILEGIVHTYQLIPTGH